MVFEPRVGGHIIDRGVDGSECRWARVLAYEPPTRLVFSWDIAWTGRSRPTPRAPARSRCASSPSPRSARGVELEHRGIERHGEGWEAMHAAVGSPNGWQIGLERFASRVSPPGGHA